MRARNLPELALARMATAGVGSPGELRALTESLGALDGPISRLRARLLESREFKTALLRQGRSSAAVRLLRMAHLPHRVWVVEMQDRAARNRGNPAAWPSGYSTPARMTTFRTSACPAARQAALTSGPGRESTRDLKVVGSIPTRPRLVAGEHVRRELRDRLATTRQQTNVEPPATEIQSSVQHENGPPCARSSFIAVRRITHCASAECCSLTEAATGASAWTRSPAAVGP